MTRRVDSLCFSSNQWPIGDLVDMLIAMNRPVLPVPLDSFSLASNSLRSGVWLRNRAALQLVSVPDGLEVKC